MKTVDSAPLQADPVISEVRRVKTALAAKHNFDVMAMTRELQEREKKQKCATVKGVAEARDETSGDTSS
jgi:flagellar biosynthesis regulator FlbT